MQNDKLLMDILLTADRIADKLLEITKQQKDFLAMMEEFHNRQAKVLSYMDQKKIEARIEREISDAERGKLKAQVMYWLSQSEEMKR